jgi:peptidyl-prolyl cis-trans isomerase C
MDVAGPGTKDRAEAERILRTVLARRGVSLDEFRLTAYRNAYLRRLATPLVEPGITDDALKVEFDRIYGPKVQIRHIQLSDSNAISTALQALDKGADFLDLARQISQNVDSAPEGGLLTPFSRLDPNVPAEIREAAFGLEIGKVSGPIRIDGWTQIVRLEKRLPAEPVEYAKVIADVRRSLTDQLVRQKMQQLLRNMLQSASIQVYDGELGKQFQALREAK